MLCWFRKKNLFEYAIGKLNFVQTQNIEDHLTVMTVEEYKQLDLQQREALPGELQ